MKFSCAALSTCAVLVLGAEAARPKLKRVPEKQLQRAKGREEAAAATPKFQRAKKAQTRLQHARARKGPAAKKPRLAARGAGGYPDMSMPHQDYDYEYSMPDHGDYGDYAPDMSMPHDDYGDYAPDMSMPHPRLAVKRDHDYEYPDMSMPHHDYDYEYSMPHHGDYGDYAPDMSMPHDDYGDESRLAMPGDKKKQPSPRLAVKRRAE